MSVPGWTAPLDPIGLDELVDRAALLTRVDRKYALRVADARRLWPDLPDSARVLDIDGRRAFSYASTYGDTPDRLSYLLAGRSCRLRWKVRTRTYCDSGATWLEVKTRAARARTVKHRIPLEVATGRRFVAGLIGEDVARALVPALRVSYRRTTLFLPASGARATVDVDLAWATPDGARGLACPDLVVVETKGGSTPSELDRLLWEHGHRPVRLSKFGAGTAALHPQLPRLKWQRTLARHVGVLVPVSVPVPVPVSAPVAPAEAASVSRA